MFYVGNFIRIKSKESLKIQEEEKNKNKVTATDGLGCLVWIIGLYLLYKWLIA